MAECTVVGCDRPVLHRELCRPHYQRLQVHAWAIHGYSVSSIARAFGISRRTVRGIRDGTAWVESLGSLGVNVPTAVRGGNV